MIDASYNEDTFAHELNRTVEHWKEWSEKSSYAGPHSDLVTRSALVLKLLTFNRTGAIIAAPTTSLPERLGGDLNWDYRYTWLRDSGLILDVLQRWLRFAVHLSIVVYSTGTYLG